MNNPLAIPRRRYFPFGLRTLFVVLTVVAVLIFVGWRWYGHPMDEVDGYYVGMTKQQIVDRLGAPTTDASMPSLWFDDEMNARREEHFIYSRLNGDLLIRVWDDAGRRVCFASSLISHRHTVEAAIAIFVFSLTGLAVFLEITSWWNRKREKP